MEILLWLAPAAVVTLLAMAWAGWAGREHRAQVDPEVAARRLGEALDRSSGRARYAAPQPEPDRSTGVAVRPSRRAS